MYNRQNHTRSFTGVLFNQYLHMIISKEEDIILEIISAKHAEGLLKAVNHNREHLSSFLPWVKYMQTVDDFSNYIARCEQLNLQEQELNYVIFLKGVIVGRIGLHDINLQHRNASLGYWITTDASGKGIITRCCSMLITYAFNVLALERIEIRAAFTNLKSRAIPEKLHFTHEGILRKADLVNGVFHDLCVYSILKDEWTGE